MSPHTFTTTAARDPDRPPSGAADHDASTDPRGYRAFPIFESRNWYQARIEVPLLVRALNLPSGGRILEIGSGPGVALPVIDRLLEPRRLVGVDIDRSLLTRAAARLEAHGTSAELTLADVRGLPFDDGSFDLVIDFGTCYHITDPAVALREIARVLVAGGLFATESKLNQILSHPIRTRGRSLPWRECADLTRARYAGLWMSCHRS